MKRKVTLAVMAFTLMMSTALAETDVLLETNPADAVVGSDAYVIETIRPEVKRTVHEFAAQWAAAREAVQIANQHQEEGNVTKIDKAWLDSVKKAGKHTYAFSFRDHMIGRVHFYERSHNWNGENENTRTYNYISYMGAHNQGEEYYINSYGFNVLRTLADTLAASLEEAEQSGLQGDAFIADVEERIQTAMEATQKTVQNDELRYYVNHTVWYAAKQTMKVQYGYEPLQKEQHVVDIRSAIQ